MSNNDFFLEQHYPTDRYKKDAVCFLMIHIQLSIHNLGIVPGEYLTFPTKEQDGGSLWQTTDPLHSDKLHDWNTSPSVIRVKKIRQEWDCRGM